MMRAGLQQTALNPSVRGVFQRQLVQHHLMRGANFSRNSLMMRLNNPARRTFGNQGFLMTLGAMAYFYNQAQQSEKTNECCGIVGYIGNQRDAGKVCMNGLKILESRGYDSCGMVSIDHK